MSIGDTAALTALSVGAVVGSPQMLKLWRHTTTRYRSRMDCHGETPTFTAAGLLLVVTRVRTDSQVW